MNGGMEMLLYNDVFQYKIGKTSESLQGGQNTPLKMSTFDTFL